MIESILWVLFTVGCVLVSTVILLQEGKGGGLGEAFGGAGAQTFGVKAAGINKFTTWVACIVILLAIAITKMRSGGGIVEGDLQDTAPLIVPPGTSAPAQTGGAGATTPEEGK